MTAKKFLEVRVNTGAGLDHNIIIARLDTLGFNGFVEEEDHVLAYMEQESENLSAVKELLSGAGLEAVSLNLIEDQNWNEIWESDYKPVILGTDVVVRAPFHEGIPGVKYDIIIEPRMAFGTAHHETTEQMLKMIYDIDIEGKTVLDMGCGTAVLAILAGMKGAAKIVAIDNDEWAYQNSIDNIALNKGIDIEVLLGDAGLLQNMQYDIIFANINRNILLEDIPRYADVLAKNGHLLMSGFYLDDLPMIEDKAASVNLSLQTKSVKNSWMAASFIKN